MAQAPQCFWCCLGGEGLVSDFTRDEKATAGREYWPVTATQAQEHASQESDRTHHKPHQQERRSTKAHHATCLPNATSKKMMAYDTRPSYSTPRSFTSSTAPGRHAHLFRPPQSPASSAYNSTSSDYFSSNKSRKRSRAPSHTPAPRQSYNQQAQSWVQCPTPSDASYTSAGAGASQPMYVNERYTLAGGFDTPSLEATSAMEQRFLRPGIDGRTRQRGTLQDDGRDAMSIPLTGPLARERNGVARFPAASQSTSSWAGFAFALVTKAFSFGTGLVRGFYSGGGKGYDLHHSPSGANLQSIFSDREACSTPVPGAWNEDDFLGDFEQDNPSFSPASEAQRPVNKRRQTNKEAWVMVGTPDLETSPRRKVSGNSVPRSQLVATRPSASRASSRRSLAPLPTRRSSSQAVYATGSPAAAAVRAEKRASFAPVRSNSSPSSSGGGGEMAYISPEAGKYMRKRERQEKKADAAMSDMGRRLAELIRQGQEALGTRVSVEEEGGGGAIGLGGKEEDEGFVDEEW